MRIPLMTRLGHWLRGHFNPSGLHHDLDRFVLVHGSIAIRAPVEPDRPVEDAARFDPALKYVGEQFGDACPHRGRTVAHADVAVEHRLRVRDRVAGTDLFSFYAGGLWCSPCLGANPTDIAIIFILERMHRSYSLPDDKNNIAILRHVILIKKIKIVPRHLSL